MDEAFVVPVLNRSRVRNAASCCDSFGGYRQRSTTIRANSYHSTPYYSSSYRSTTYQSTPTPLSPNRRYDQRLFLLQKFDLLEFSQIT